MAKSEFEVVIVGAGPAGLSASIWARELGLSSLVLESLPEAGGQLLKTYNPITNYLGVDASDGTEMRNLFMRQVRGQKIRIRFDSRIASANPEENSVTAENSGNGKQEVIRYEYLVFGAGVRRRTLDVPGEVDYLGKGILHSGKRDGKLAAGGNAVVIGGGDAAFENALILADHAGHVTLIHRREGFSARPEFVSKVANDARISIRTSCEATRFAGRGRLESVFIREKGANVESELEASTAVIRIGVVPNSDVLTRHVVTDEFGYIEVDSQCRTSDPNIYAVGDVANRLSPTISSAAGMGTTAVKSIRNRLAAQR